MASLIVAEWIQTTLKVENEWAEFGTGFLISKRYVGEGERYFLLTNKHVLSANKKDRSNASNVRLHGNYEKDGNIERFTMDFDLRTERAWKEHPDPDVDVLAIHVTPMFVQIPNIHHKTFPIAEIAAPEKLVETSITAGDTVMVFGYPAGIEHSTTNTPFVRSGLISSQIGSTLIDEVDDENGNARTREIRGFLVDGATVPGQSGSPVVLAPTIGRATPKGITMGASPAMLIGIIAETRYAPVRTKSMDIESFAGFGLAFDAETVTETIQEFD